MLLALLVVAAVQAEPWRQPPPEVLAVLHAPDLPWVWAAPDGGHLLLADGVLYPPLADLAAPMHPLAGVRVDSATRGFWGETGALSPRLLRVADGVEIPLALPADLEVMNVAWTADGQRFALTVEHADHVGVWLGAVDGRLREVRGLALDPLLGSDLAWMPDQRRLLVKRVALPDPPPEAPAVPDGPQVLVGAGDAPRSTYEARNLLRTAHDEALFVHFATSRIAVVDGRGRVEDLGEPGIYGDVSASPDGNWLLVERLLPPWSHEAGWWRFAHAVEVWSADGEPRAALATLPLQDAVPVQGVPVGMRGVGWRPTAPATLVWIEALDGGDPIAEVAHRDRILAQDAPFTAAPRELFLAEHRVRNLRWGEAGGLLLVSQWERERRWRHEWLLDVEAGTARPWFDLSENERYADPGQPLMKPLPNGRSVLRQAGERVWFAGAGATPDGDRPFLDLRPLGEGAAERVWRCDPEHYEVFVAFAGAGRLLTRRESPSEVPNYHLVAAGETARAETDVAVTRFADPAPQVRAIQHRIVTYARADGTPLSFHLYLPPGYREGERLPTVLYAYPLEYSDPGTAGQVSGSAQRFLRLRGSSHLFFLLRGYAVLDQTAMPVVGDPETAYDTFVEQLVADAEAAVAEAVRLGVTDPDRVGVTGHSHGALMTVTLLAHSDLFRAGIARSGAYNHTLRPFGFQGERRSLWEARDTYLGMSPVMFAPQIDEPLLLIHGAIDENPGTVPLQSERLFEAVRGTGGTVRLVTLPFEGHGYQARESVEQVLAEQIEWFDRYLGPPHDALPPR